MQSIGVVTPNLVPLKLSGVVLTKCKLYTIGGGGGGRGRVGLWLSIDNTARWGWGQLTTGYHSRH